MIEKLNDEIILSYLYTFERVYDNKKSTAYIVDRGSYKSLSFLRALGDPGTDEYINEQIYNEFGKFASETSLKRILKMLVYDTRKNGKEAIVHYRVANTNKAIYVNMGTWLILKITAKKILTLKNASVKFTIHNTLGKMAIPDFENGDVNLLKKYILVNQSEFKLILVFIFNCFFTNTHYVMLVLMGPAGSAKSFITKVIKAIIDPSPITLRNQPRKAESLIIAAIHCHLIDMNNCSKLSDEIQDIICTILTGGVATAREFYTNKGQSAIHTHNPVVLNGIGAIVTRDDALERSLCIHLNKVSESDITPISEKQLEEEFNADLPKIMGGIFKALQAIMLEYQTFETDEKLTRMADFHKLGLITEQALSWKGGSFTKAYKANISSSHYETLESNKVAQALIKLKSLKSAPFKGTYLELRDKLMVVGDIGQMEPRELSGILARLGGALLNLHGIQVTKLKRSGPGSRVRITYK